MLSDAQWALLEPLIEACRPKGKTPPQDLRRTVSAAAARSTGRLSGLDLQQPQCCRAALGQIEGVASRCNPLREDRTLLHGCALSRGCYRLDQALTRPSARS